MARAISFQTGHFYHIYNRGVDKRLIFSDSHDYNRFLLLLYLCNSAKPLSVGTLMREKNARFMDLWNTERGDRLVDIGAYCLMPNHYHLLVRERREGGISLFMQKLATSYTLYFNSKYTRTGSLFEGRFRVKEILGDRYFYHLLGYVHLNPVKLIDPAWKEEGIEDLEKARDYLRDYQFSSYLDFLGIGRVQKKVLDTDEFPPYFTFGKGFRDYLEGWLGYDENEIDLGELAEASTKERDNEDVEKTVENPARVQPIQPPAHNLLNSGKTKDGEESGVVQ